MTRVYCLRKDIRQMYIGAQNRKGRKISMYISENGKGQKTSVYCRSKQKGTQDKFFIVA